MTNKQLEATAYHEAGHAVLGVYFGWKLRAVSIIPREGSAGRVARHLKRSIENPDWCGDYAALGRRFPAIITSLAGDVAQRKYRASSYRTWQPRRDFETVT